MQTIPQCLRFSLFYYSMCVYVFVCVCPWPGLKVSIYSCVTLATGRAAVFTQHRIKMQLINQTFSWTVEKNVLFFTLHHLLFYICFRILLTVVAVLSSYSIHLLLKSSGVVGAYISGIQLRLLWLGLVFLFHPLNIQDTTVAPTCVQDASCLQSHVSTFTCKVSSCVCGSGIRAYEQLGYRAFGTPGKMAAGIAITLQNIGGEVTPPSVLMPGFWEGAYHIMSPLNTSLSIFYLNECLRAFCLQPCPVTCTSSSMSFLWSSRPFWKWITLQGEEATHRINTLFIQ